MNHRTKALVVLTLLLSACTDPHPRPRQPDDPFPDGVSETSMLGKTNSPSEWTCFDYDLEPLAQDLNKSPWQWRASLCYPKGECDAGRAAAIRSAIAELDVGASVVEKHVGPCTSGFNNPWCFVARATDRTDRVYCAESEQDCKRNSSSFRYAPMSACVDYDLVQEELHAARRREHYCADDDKRSDEYTPNPKYGRSCGLSEWHCMREAEAWRSTFKIESRKPPKPSCAPVPADTVHCGLADLRSLDKSGRPRLPRRDQIICSQGRRQCDARVLVSLGAEKARFFAFSACVPE
jgi:hypothetical protein